MPADLIAPHGGTLVQLVADENRARELHQLAREAPSWTLTPRQLCDLELLLNGGFSPLTGFLGPSDYDSVCERMRLADGTLWPIPVTLDVDEATAAALNAGTPLFLRDPEGVPLAALHVEHVWKPDRDREAELVYGSTHPEHPAVAYLRHETHPYYVGGRVEGLHLPAHYDFVEYRLTPRELRRRFAEKNWRQVIAFQTRNPMHRAHLELTFRAAKEIGSRLLIHPVVGRTKTGDVDHYTRVRCYLAILKHYPPGTAMLSLLPLAMRMGGPREAVWHAIIRKNYGCTHLIVGRDHAGPGADSSGRPFYGPYEAQDLLRRHEKELGVTMVPFRMMVYLPERGEFVAQDEVPEGAAVESLSGTELRRLLAEGRDIPEWFSFPEVIQELRRTHPPRHRQGFTVFFTGLPSSGKSTLAKALLAKLLEVGGRPVTLLDGDIVRTHLSSELGFSKEHRNLNIHRIGFVASEITKNGGIAICAPIAPYDRARREVRKMIEARGGFILVHVSTPLSVCEQRDRKGLYAKARAGIIREFTGISDPYEVPADADLAIDTSDLSPEECVERVVAYLENAGYLRRPDDTGA